MYDVGDTALFSNGSTAYPIKDATGAATDVAGMAATVTLPDATTAVLTVTHVSTGVYTAPYTFTQAGRHLISWTGTGYHDTSVAVVRPTDPGWLMSLEDAKSAVGLPATPSTNDDFLRDLLASITPMIENITGPLVPRTVTETVYGRADGSGQTTIVLSQAPVIAIQSMTPQLVGTVSTDLTALVINASGVIRLANWYPFYGPMLVTYTAGTTTIPANVNMAAKELFQIIYTSTQQDNRPGFIAQPEMGANARSVQEVLDDLSGFYKAPVIA